MNSRESGVERLQADDINGIRAIYGSSSSRGQPGHADHCRDYGPCRAGIGDCDPGQCATGLVCANDVGARYGLPAHYDVCEAGTPRPDPDYCVSNYCGLGDGDCDPGQCDEGVCVNDVGAQYGLPAHYDVCEAGTPRPDPDYCVSNYCGLGDGDCDPGQCDEGVCVNDVGAQYGLPAHYDVCEAREGPAPDPDYCVSNYCGLGDGDCDPGQCDEGVCVNDVGARYGLPAHYDVCEARSRPDPNYCVYNYCGIGDGDCDPGQCDEGVCVNDVGARYGLPAHYDVCEASDSGRSSLNDLLGTWRFRYTIISTFTSTYRLSQVDTSTGTSLIVGTNEYGNPVAAGRIQDVNPGNPLPHEFALLDPGSIICQLFVFDKTGINRVEGFYFQIRSPNGQCGGTVSDPYQMTGTRTSQAQSSIQGQLAPQGTVLEQSNAEIQSLEETTPLDLSSPDEADSTAIRDMINMLSSTLD